MSPLCVFLCESQIKYDQILKNTEEAKYHRFFILSSKQIIRNNLAHKNSDNFMTYCYDLEKIEELARLITCYSNPMYSHIFIFLNDSMDFENQKLNFSNEDYFQNSSCVGFTRQHVALHGFHFDPLVTELPIDPITYAQELGRALNEEPVEHKIFLEAIKELLPFCEFTNYKEIKELDSDIKSIISSKYKKSSTVYNVLYEPNFQKFSNAIVFSFQKLDSYKFAIKRNDGLCCYLF